MHHIKGKKIYFPIEEYLFRIRKQGIKDINYMYKNARKIKGVDENTGEGKREERSK